MGLDGHWTDEGRGLVMVEGVMFSAAVLDPVQLMLLCMSTGLRLSRDAGAGLAIERHQQPVDLPGDEPFEAADDLQLAFALCGSAFCVSAGGLIPAQADQGNPVQGAIRLTVATSVQPMPMGFA